MGTSTPYNEQYNPQADPTPAPAATDTTTSNAGQAAGTAADSAEEPEARRAFVGELVNFKPLPSTGGGPRAAVVMDVHKSDGTADLKVFLGYGLSTTDVRDVESADSTTPGKFTFLSETPAKS